jgi:hypothetical protein
LGNLVLDSKGNLHFVCKQLIPSQHLGLSYVSFNGTSWNLQSVVLDVDVYSMYLALDSHDDPHISYITYTPSNTTLMYAYLTGAVWNIQAIPDSYTSRNLCCLAVDSNGKPHISFYRTSASRLTGSVMYATADETTQHFTNPSQRLSNQTSPIIPALPLLFVLTLIIVAAGIILLYVSKKTVRKWHSSNAQFKI